MSHRSLYSDDWTPSAALAALEAAAERKRERELVERTRNRKVPMSYQQRLAKGLQQRLR